MWKMNERNPLVIVSAGIFKAVKCVFAAIAWCIIVLCVMTKNR